MTLRRSLLLALACVSGCGDPLPEEWPPGYFCGVGDDDKFPGEADKAGGEGVWRGPIVNGQTAPDPTVVALSDGQVLAVGALVAGSNFCTGTLVADNLVLTAAHCVEGMGAGDFDFAVGPDSARPLHSFGCREVHANPGWDGSSSHDTAVCVLDGFAQDAVPEIRPILINEEPLQTLAPAFVGRRVQNVGFGSTEPGGGGSNTQRWWTVEPVVDLGGDDFTVDGGGVSSVCFGDSGGPSLFGGADGTVRVAGTVHGGDPSCTGQDVFARTDRDAEWIRSFVEWAPGCRLGEAGRCDGDVAEWCVGEGEADLRRDDCAARGRLCGRTEAGLFRCLAGVQPCPDGLTFEGRCDGDVALWCETSGERRLLRRRYCAPCGLVCRWVDRDHGYYCAEPL